MPVNADKPHLWKQDIALSVDMFNGWFVEFAPAAYQDTRAQTSQRVQSALSRTSNLTDISPDVLAEEPSMVAILRMATAPPIARDRLIGLANVPSNLVTNMENHNRVPPRMSAEDLQTHFRQIRRVIEQLADRDIFHWLDSDQEPDQLDLYRAATIVADRLCGAISDPIIRNAQEQRQLTAIGGWLEEQGYSMISAGQSPAFDKMDPGTYAFRLNVAVQSNNRAVNIPIDTVVMPLTAEADDRPVLIEAKSAGDFTNTNKRRKEEAMKVSQLRETYGENLTFVLFLCGYFDSGYLGYEAAEGIDWVWEHRIEDLKGFGV